MFSRYLLLQKRIAQIRSWIEKCGDEGRVHGKVMTLKTITGRMAHNNPNMAQVPASYSPYGADLVVASSMINTLSAESGIVTVLFAARVPVSL